FPDQIKSVASVLPPSVASHPIWSTCRLAAHLRRVAARHSRGAARNYPCWRTSARISGRRASIRIKSVVARRGTDEAHAVDAATVQLTREIVHGGRSDTIGRSGGIHREDAGRYSQH